MDTKATALPAAHMVPRSAALMLIDEKEHNTMLASSGAAMRVERRGLSSLTTRAQLHRLGTPLRRQAVRDPALTQLLAPYLLHELQASAAH